jgi:hypothetical protein
MAGPLNHQVVQDVQLYVGVGGSQTYGVLATRCVVVGREHQHRFRPRLDRDIGPRFGPETRNFSFASSTAGLDWFATVHGETPWIVLFPFDCWGLRNKALARQCGVLLTSAVRMN